MSLGFGLAYLAIYAAGIFTVARKYKDTRARDPGVVAFFLLAVAQAGALATSPLQPLGPAFEAAIDTIWLIRSVAAILLVAALFLMIGRVSGAPAKRVAVGAAIVAFLALLAMHFAIYFDVKSATRYWMLYEALVRGAGALALLSQLRATRWSALAAAGLACLALVNIGRLYLQVPVAGSLYVAVSGASWASIFAFLLFTPPPPQLPAPAGVGGAIQAAGMALGLLPLFYWQIYETIAGGPVTSYFRWAGIPLPLVLLLLVWFATCGWLALLLSACTREAPSGG